MRPLLVLVVAGWLVSSACGDAGLVRLSEEVGKFRITVFTSPTPFRAGPVEIGVLVQDTATDRTIRDVDVSVSIAPRHRPTDETHYRVTDTGPLIPAVNFELPTGGWWRVRVKAKGSLGEVEKSFELEADEPPPRWREMILWIALPLVPVGLYIMHQWLVRRREHA
jgi:hypothetical protein